MKKVLVPSNSTPFFSRHQHLWVIDEWSCSPGPSCCVILHHKPTYMMQPNHGGSGGQQMNTSQLSIQELQRLQQEMQARLRHQQQSTSQDACMMMQQQRLAGQQMGNQQQVQRNSLAGMDNATLLLLQQQQQQLTGGARRSITGGMSEPNSTQAALYMNAMQSNNRTERQNSLGSQSSVSSMGRFAGGMNQNPNQLPSRNGGGPSLQSQAMFLKDNNNNSSSTWDHLQC